MNTAATRQKRQDLMVFIEQELVSEPAVQAVVGIGSIANGLARPDSDIDAIVFLDPFDWYVTPAEFLWNPAENTFHSIFSEAPSKERWMQFDFARLDLARWAAPSFEWSEERCAELQEGWLAFDRSGRVATLIETRTAYPNAIRISKLDEAITWLDQHLSDDGVQARWESLGPVIAYDRLQAAYEYLVQALFAYNRRWRPWRNREMSSLLALAWLPDHFADQVPGALGASSIDYAGYMSRVHCLRGLFQDITQRLVSEGEYGVDIIGEAFIRSHDEPGRAWNMNEWNRKHAIGR
ncbi:MAG TPA: nucleotidyltransferase domain-containing protein [Anaerolineales bacterium]|nr:nucleotidyltransferase domain-containing protein [Anaerolineales bacterium]